MLSSRYLSLASLLVALASPAAADILTVGPDGSGAQFTQIQAAIDVAENDDVILVQPGTYERIVVERPLRILGVAPGVLIEGGFNNSAVLVRDIPAGQEFVLSGVGAHASSFGPVTSTIRLEDSPGTAILQDVSIQVSPGEGAIGVRSTACGRVLLLESRIQNAGALEAQTGAVVMQQGELWVSDCEITGADDPFIAYSGAHGIEATDATLRVWRSQIIGGGAEGKNGTGEGQGGDGIRATRSSIHLFGGPGSSVHGGNGQELIFEEGLGGPGVELLDHSSARVQDDIPISGGIDGFGLTQAPAVRADGTSTFTLDPKVFPTVASDSTRLALGSKFTLTLTGNPGGYHVLHVSLRTGPTTTFPNVDGALLLDRNDLHLVTIQVLPGSGSLELPLEVPDALGLLGLTFDFQTAERLPTFVRLAQSHPSRFAIGNPLILPVTE